MKDEIFELCDVVRIAGYEAHRYLRHGHLEKIYERSLFNRLSALGVEVKQQFPLPVYDEDGSLLGDFYADLFVEGKLIIELKACRAVTDVHTSQLLGYLRASRIEHGLLVNFGAPKYFIKKSRLSRRLTLRTATTFLRSLRLFAAKRILTHAFPLAPF